MEPLACGRDLGTEEKWGRHKQRERKERISVLCAFAEQGEEAASLPRGWCIYVAKKHIGSS